MVPNLQSDISEREDWPLPGAIAGFVETAAALFDVDRSTSYRFLNRAVALVRTTRALRRDCAASRYQELPPRGGLAAWQVGRVMSYIQDNLGVSMKVKDLASLVNLSAGQFFRAFKVSVGVPPFHYILRKRLDLACKMMATTDESLSQIAIACGLYDQSHLCRMFRRMMGESPNAWRRKNASGPPMKHLVSIGEAAFTDVETALNRHGALPANPATARPADMTRLQLANHFNAWNLD